MAKMHPKRLAKIERVVKARQPDLTVVLENVHDGHNVGAVLRTADAIGVQSVFILNTHPNLAKKKLKLGKKTSSGARKWLDVHYYRDLEACFEHVKQKHKLIYGAALMEDTISLYNIDFCQPIALVFGNEHEGISNESLSHCNGIFSIPQKGMTESLNISVACAVTMFEAMRQRELSNYYNEHPSKSLEDLAKLKAEYIERHSQRYKAREVIAKDVEL